MTILKDKGLEDVCFRDQNGRDKNDLWNEEWWLNCTIVTMFTFFRSKMVVWHRMVCNVCVCECWKIKVIKLHKIKELCSSPIKNCSLPTKLLKIPLCDFSHAAWVNSRMLWIMCELTHLGYKHCEFSAWLKSRWV